MDLGSGFRLAQVWEAPGGTDKASLSHAGLCQPPWTGKDAHGCGCTPKFTDVLISMGMDPSSSSDERLPLKSSPILNFAVLRLISSQFSPSSHSCLQAAGGCVPTFCPEQFTAGTSSQMATHCCHLQGLCSVRFLPHGCSGPVFLVFARKGKRENHQKTTPLQNRLHKPSS